MIDEEMVMTYGNKKTLTKSIPLDVVVQQRLKTRTVPSKPACSQPLGHVTQRLDVAAVRAAVT